jgi:hypothetical protein
MSVHSSTVDFSTGCLRSACGIASLPPTFICSRVKKCQAMHGIVADV